MLENFIVVAQQVLVLFILISLGFACGKKKNHYRCIRKAYKQPCFVFCYTVRYGVCFSA